MLTGLVCLVALAISADGTKIPVGLWDGSTENKAVVRSLLADLVERGLAVDDGLLVVLDGAKALYPDILNLVESRLRPGAFIVADNADETEDIRFRLSEVPAA